MSIFRNWTEAQIERHNRQVRGERETVATEGVPAGQEIELLHKPILKWLNSQHPKVAYHYSRPDQPATGTPGEPDFIFCWRGQTLHVECKTAKGKLSPDQLAWHMMARLAGVSVYIVRSMDQFYALVNDKPAPSEPEAGLKP